MFEIKNVMYQRSENINQLFLDDAFTIVDEDACKKLIGDNFDISQNHLTTLPIHDGLGAIILGKITPSRVKRFRDYDFHAKIVITPKDRSDSVFIVDTINAYPGHGLLVLYERGDNEDLTEKISTENINPNNVIGGVLVKGSITDFMNNFKKREDIIFKTKLKSVFNINNKTTLWMYASNAEDFNFISQKDISDILEGF